MPFVTHWRNSDDSKPRVLTARQQTYPDRYSATGSTHESSCEHGWSSQPLPGELALGLIPQLPAPSRYPGYRGILLSRHSVGFPTVRGELPSTLPRLCSPSETKLAAFSALRTGNIAVTSAPERFLGLTNAFTTYPSSNLFLTLLSVLDLQWESIKNH